MIRNGYDIGDMHVSGFLFDLDGVIIDSERAYTRIWEKIEREYPTGVQDFAHKIKGTTLENILGEYYPREEVRCEVRKRLYEEEAVMRYRFCPGAEELLQRLGQKGVPVALYTSSDGYKMSHLYRDIPQLKDYFNVIVTGDDVTDSKPDPEGYVLAAKGLGLQPGECAVVEDSLQGVKAGRAAGAKVVGVEGSVPAEVLAPYCDIIIPNLMKL